MSNEKNKLNSTVHKHRSVKTGSFKKKKKKARIGQQLKTMMIRKTRRYSWYRRRIYVYIHWRRPVVMPGGVICTTMKNALECVLPYAAADVSEINLSRLAFPYTVLCSSTVCAACTCINWTVKNGLWAEDNQCLRRTTVCSRVTPPTRFFSNYFVRFVRRQLRG